MKRIVAAVFVWIVCVGGLALYMSQRQAALPVPVKAAAARNATAAYVLEVTASFAAEPDPFAVHIDSEPLPPVLVIRLGSRQILRITESLAAGRPVRVDPLPGLVFGDNELFVAASPPADQADRRHALRLTVFENNRPIAEKTIWSEPGAAIAEVMRFSLAPTPEKDDSHEQ